MLGIKQQVLAGRLGETWTQKKISILEQKEFIPPSLLNRLSGALGVPVEALSDFDTETMLRLVRKYCKDGLYRKSLDWSADPMRKIIQLYEERIALLERLLESEKQKVTLLDPHHDNIGVKERGFV